MSINIVGKYVSEDERYTLDITESYPQQSRFEGTFTVKNTPKGEVVYKINNDGSAGWFYTSDQRHAGIGFMVSYCAEQTTHRDFVLFDCWAGYISSENVLFMSGSRSHTKNHGGYDLFTFGNVRFNKTKC